MTDFIKKPCQHCPFRHDVKPFLHPERAYDIALHAERGGYFPCHKTTEHDDDGETVYSEAEKQCAGAITLACHEQSEESIQAQYPGFEPAWDKIYEDSYVMWDAYQEVWDEARNN